MDDGWRGWCRVHSGGWEGGGFEGGEQMGGGGGGGKGKGMVEWFGFIYLSSVLTLSILSYPISGVSRPPAMHVLDFPPLQIDDGWKQSRGARRRALFWKEQEASALWV